MAPALLFKLLKMQTPALSALNVNMIRHGQRGRTP